MASITITGLVGPPAGRDTAGLLSGEGLIVRTWSEFVKSVAMLVVFSWSVGAYMSIRG